MSITALNLSHITYTYPGAPEPIFEDVTVTFAPGWTAVLGDNGIGKSTLMHIARGALTPERGSQPVRRGYRLLSAGCRRRTCQFG